MECDFWRQGKLELEDQTELAHLGHLRISVKSRPMLKKLTLENSYTVGSHNETTGPSLKSRGRKTTLSSHLTVGCCFSPEEHALLNLLLFCQETGHGVTIQLINQVIDCHPSHKEDCKFKPGTDFKKHFMTVSTKCLRAPESALRNAFSYPTCTQAIETISSPDFALVQLTSLKIDMYCARIHLKLRRMPPVTWGASWDDNLHSPGLVFNKRPQVTENDEWSARPPTFTPKLEWCDIDLDKLGVVGASALTRNPSILPRGPYVLYSSLKQCK
ncbi:unnamed protein product [Tetraodon nigroviridis]|uniref:(spotted green pufferfish) hypothetical protein n=1 Tax=Tetraodon nigroviridis TaxID=99883 RepID=Q4RY16_TETNG|nr:unnamed protein product [Tetraodon nigroviridis]